MVAEVVEEAVVTVVGEVVDEVAAASQRRIPLLLDATDGRHSLFRFPPSHFLDAAPIYHIELFDAAPPAFCGKAEDFTTVVPRNSPFSFLQKTLLLHC